MSTLFKLTTTAAFVLAAGVASAQSSDTKATGNEKSPDEVKCHEIVTMDTAVVPATLYYIAGYRSGSGGNTGGTSGSSGSSGSDSGTSSSKSSSGSSGSQSSSSSDSGTSSTMKSSGKSSETGSAASSAPQMQIVRVRGFYEIPVADVITACAERPESNVSDVMDEKRGSTNSKTSSGTKSDTK